jgi:hypothetical protein
MNYIAMAKRMPLLASHESPYSMSATTVDSTDLTFEELRISDRVIIDLWREDGKARPSKTRSKSREPKAKREAGEL